MRIRIIAHFAVENTGSFEVRFPDGRPSVYFYWDDVPSRRLRPEQMTSEEVKAKAEARPRGAEQAGPLARIQTSNSFANFASRKGNMDRDR